MHLPAQRYEGILPLSDACIFVKENGASCKGKVLQRVEHHSWGGPFVAEKMRILSAQSKKEIGPFGTLQIFDFCYQTSYEQLPYPFPEFGSFLIPQSCLPEYELRGEPPFSWMNRFIMAIFYASPRAKV